MSNPQGVPMKSSVSRGHTSTGSFSGHKKEKYDRQRPSPSQTTFGDLLQPVLNQQLQLRAAGDATEATEGIHAKILAISSIRQVDPGAEGFQPSSNSTSVEMPSGDLKRLAEVLYGARNSMEGETIGDHEFPDACLASLEAALSLLHDPTATAVKESTTGAKEGSDDDDDEDEDDEEKFLQQAVKATLGKFNASKPVAEKRTKNVYVSATEGAGGRHCLFQILCMFGKVMEEIGLPSGITAVIKKYLASVDLGVKGANMTDDEAFQLLQAASHTPISQVTVTFEVLWDMFQAFLDDHVVNFRAFDQKMGQIQEAFAACFGPWGAKQLQTFYFGYKSVRDEEGYTTILKNIPLPAKKAGQAILSRKLLLASVTYPGSWNKEGSFISMDSWKLLRALWSQCRIDPKSSRVIQLKGTGKNASVEFLKTRASGEPNGDLFTKLAAVFMSMMKCRGQHGAAARFMVDVMADKGFDQPELFNENGRPHTWTLLIACLLDSFGEQLRGEPVLALEKLIRQYQALMDAKAKKEVPDDRKKEHVHQINLTILQMLDILVPAAAEAHQADPENPFIEVIRAYLERDLEKALARTRERLEKETRTKSKHPQRKLQRTPAKVSKSQTVPTSEDFPDLNGQVGAKTITGLPRPTEKKVATPATGVWGSKSKIASS